MYLWWQHYLIVLHKVKYHLVKASCVFCFESQFELHQVVFIFYFISRSEHFSLVSDRSLRLNHLINLRRRRFRRRCVRWHRVRRRCVRRRCVRWHRGCVVVTSVKIVCSQLFTLVTFCVVQMKMTSRCLKEKTLIWEWTDGLRTIGKIYD